LSRRTVYMQRGREVKPDERARVTAAIMATVVPNSVAVGPFCTCSEHPYPHPAHTDEEAVFEYHRNLRPKRKHIVGAKTMSTKAKASRRVQRIQSRKVGR